MRPGSRSTKSEKRCVWPGPVRFSVSPPPKPSERKGASANVSDSVPVLQLMQTKGLGPRALSRLIDSLDQENLTPAEFVALSPKEMTGRFGLNEEQANTIRSNERIATELSELLDRHNVRLFLRNSSSYPPRLQAVLKDKAPPVLFVGGDHDLLGHRGVGFCGARDASTEALRCADQVARALVQHGLLVVSGNAPGVDENAHRAALDSGGKTVVVAPEGILQFRPRSSFAELLTDDNFVAISEFPPRLPWSVANAMQRNRTICGLVHALIVIEAGISGGTWEAGHTALELRMPLFVLDYPNPAPSGQGNPRLLKKGGRPLLCRPGEPPDLTLLLEALELPLPSTRAGQPTLFDHLADGE